MVLVVPVAFLIGLCFSALGLLVTSLAKSYDFFMYWFTLAITPMMLLGGVFYPITSMPGWLQALSQALPLTHGVELGRPLLLGRWPDAPLVHLAVLLAYSIGGFAIALRVFRRRLLS
jgi:lipooligosaccharide transport system permease protein